VRSTESAHARDAALDGSIVRGAVDGAGAGVDAAGTPPAQAASRKVAIERSFMRLTN
jgi:hypothetical protein